VGAGRARRVIEAVVFDLDGVLIDSEQVWDEVRRDYAAARGGRWDEAATATMMGMSAPEWSAHLRDALGVPGDPAEISADVAEGVLARYRAHLPLLPGAVAAVERLAARWPLGLASSSNRSVIDTVLAVSGLDRHFAVTVSSEEVARGKPAPDVYLAAVAGLGVHLKRRARPVCRAEPAGVRRHGLGAEAARCTAVEDSTNGLRSAAAAGLRVVAIPNPHFPPAPDALALADAVVAGLDDLTPALVAGRPPSPGG
jgi:beta-phosphoglucomutase-like phosphatase (HAD superfamily)